MSASRVIRAFFDGLEREGISQAQVAVILAGFAVLTVCLWIEWRKCISADRQRSQWTGKPLDVTELKPKLAQIRRDYLAARPAPKGVCFHRACLGMVRRTVAGLGFFRFQPPDEQVSSAVVEER